MNRKPTEKLLRLNRFLARAGLGSRRGVEELIRAGRVAVNARVVTDLSLRVDPAVDRISLDGQLVNLPDRWRIYAFHKPAGVVSTLKGQGGQRDLSFYRNRVGLPERLVPVGRLDAETTGLLLWTDDGELAQALCRPRSKVWKRYVVTLDRPAAPKSLSKLQEGGLSLDGRPCLPWRVSSLPSGGGRRWEIALHEGRKRQIRRMFDLLGLRVRSLHRVAFGPIDLGRLREGDFRRLTPEEENNLLQAIAEKTPDPGKE